MSNDNYYYNSDDKTTRWLHGRGSLTEAELAEDEERNSQVTRQADAE